MATATKTATKDTLSEATYAPQARRIRRGEAPNLAGAKAADQPASNVLGVGSAAHGISATDARELGESAVTKGALERAERHVSGFQIVPKAAGPQPKKIWVDAEGKVHDSPPEGASTQLVGAEAEAYAAAHKSADTKTSKASKRKSSSRKKATSAKRKGR